MMHLKQLSVFLVTGLFMTIAGCYSPVEEVEHGVTVTVVRATGSPAADVYVETLDESGRSRNRVSTDINGVARLTLHGDDDRFHLRVDERQSYLSIPVEDTLVRLRADEPDGTVAVTFRPALVAGDEWFQPLLFGGGDFQPLARGESLTVRVPAEPRSFFVVAGNDDEGVRHVALLHIDGSTDMMFTTPVELDYDAWGQKIAVSMTGLSEPPVCAARTFPLLEAETAALVYGATATDMTVYAFSSLIFHRDDAAYMQPSALRCSFVVDAGACTGATVNGMIALSGTGKPVEVDWSDVSFIPFAPENADVLAAHLFNDGLDQPYSRDRGGFCALPTNLVPWTYLTAELQLDKGVLEAREFMTRMPDELSLEVGGDVDVDTFDTREYLEASSPCELCYSTAVVHGTFRGKAAVAYAPVKTGQARIPRALFEQRSEIELFGYLNDVAYARSVTLPMQGYGIEPGGSDLLPITQNTRFYRWNSTR